MSKYNGRCPICSTQLVIIPDGKLSCSANHYICTQSDFEGWWKWYDEQKYKSPETANLLLSKLQSLNEIKKVSNDA